MIKNQILMDFPIKHDYSAENFIQNSGNKSAMQAINKLQNNGEILVIYGQEGVGKSHLISIWKNLVNAININDIDTLDNNITNIYADDLQKFNTKQQEKLFHAFNHIKNVNGALLVVSNIPPSQMDILPDLKSRLLLGEQVEVSLSNPQEMKILLSKWAWDRQIHLPIEVVDYIITRCERSPKALVKCIAKLDLLSLEKKRKITVPLAKEALE